MKASEGYTGGAWDTDPASAAITEATTFTYTFTAKQAATVTKAPVAKTLTSNGQEQALVDAGEVTGGEMQYALGSDATTAPTEGWGTAIPSKADAGTYYVWYKVVGDDNHNDTEPANITVTIAEATGNNTPAGPVNVSPKTGESALPEMLLFIIGISAAGLVVFSRKREENR